MTVFLPKAEAWQPRRIALQIGDGAITADVSVLEGEAVAVQALIHGKIQ
ncbi:MAG: hypothetical protein AAF639_05255 [Chloroflexota bacterium]